MKKRAFTGKVTYNILFCKFFDHFFLHEKEKNYTFAPDI